MKNMSKLKHQHIVEVFDVVASSKSEEHYIVMPLLKGKTFKQWFHDKQEQIDKVDIQAFLRLICQVLDALHYAHVMGVVHRDLKPDNILLESNKEDAEIKIIDFGLSAKIDKPNSLESIVGTPYYVAPEVLDEDCTYGRS